MRALRIASVLLAVCALMVGSTIVTAATTEEPSYSITPVAGTLDVHRLPGGTFDVEDRVFQYREYPLAGTTYRTSDPRLGGDVVADWNWDVHASGDRPVPAWGTITIAGPNGSWDGGFTGIRSTDFEPMDVRALLIGDGAYEGLCATLDISVVGISDQTTWLMDGIVHPVGMSG